MGHQGLHPPRVGRREGGAGAAQRLGLESSAPRRPLPRAAVGEGDSGPGERSCALASPRPRRGQALWAQRSALPLRVPRGGPTAGVLAAPFSCQGRLPGATGQTGSPAPPGVSRAGAGRNVGVFRIWGSRERPQAFGGTRPACRRPERLGEGGYLAMKDRTREMGAGRWALPWPPPPGCEFLSLRQKSTNNSPSFPKPPRNRVWRRDGARRVGVEPAGFLL